MTPLASQTPTQTTRRCLIVSHEMRYISVGNLHLVEARPLQDRNQSSNAMDEHHSHGKKAWAVLVHFLIHALVGSLIFLIIAVPAYGLGELVKYLETQHTSTYVIRVLTFVEHAIITGDAALFLVLMFKSLYKASIEMDL